MAVFLISSPLDASEQRMQDTIISWCDAVKSQEGAETHRRAPTGPNVVDYSTLHLLTSHNFSKAKSTLQKSLP